MVPTVLDALGIDKLLSVLGGSMGGMQVLQWAARYKERVFAAVPIAAAAWLSSSRSAPFGSFSSAWLSACKPRAIKR